MPEETNKQDLSSRLELIEKMIAEGRRRQEELGLDVCAVGRGLLYCDVFFWFHGLGRSKNVITRAWPVTMTGNH